MGKGILLAVGALLASGAFLLFSAQRSTLATKEQQSDYQYQVVARDAGRSAFDQAVSSIMREGTDAVGSFENVSMIDGEYDFEINSALYGDFDLVVASRSGGAQFDIEGNVIYTAPLPAALMLEDDEMDVSGSGAYTVSGVDRRMPARAVGAAGYRAPVPGIWTRTSQVSAVTSALNASRIVGLSNTDQTVNAGSVEGNVDRAVYERIYQEVLTLPPNQVRVAGGLNPQGAVRGAAQSSRPGNPKIIRVLGDLQITQPIQGHGLLIVEEGDLEVFSSGFDWEGLVMIRKAHKDTVVVDLAGGSQIHGGLAIYDAGGAGLSAECVPEFTANGDETAVQDSFRVSIEVIGAAISYGGQYEIPVTSRINIGSQTFEPWGSYGGALSGNVNTNGRFVFAPDVVFPPGTISIDARSWVKKNGIDGATDDDWKIHLERNSASSNQNLVVLTDGMDVPDTPGFLDQASIAEFVEGYVSNGVLSLWDNEAINLFELGGTDTSSPAFDQQDLVVMVSLVNAEVNGCVAGRGVNRTELTLRHEAQVHYSSEAIAKLGLYLDEIRQLTDATVTYSATRGVARGEQVALDATATADDQEGDVELETGEEVTVCHKPTKNGGTTKTIRRKHLGKHLGHGDSAGAC